tara:strand:+ start:1066 stop:1299 length:234 start_codon:yes stop_codon:yes gene_type:complete
LSPEEDKYYENYLDLFLHPGWEQFVEETQETLDMQTIEDIKSEKDLFQLQGKRAALLNIVRFETGIKNTFDAESENA